MNQLAGEPPVEASSARFGRQAGSTWSELGPRIASAVVLMVAALGSAAAGGLVFDLFWLLASAGILWEWLRLVGGSGRLGRFALGAGMLAGVAAMIGHFTPLASFALIVAGAITMAVVSPPGARLMSAAGFVYAGCLALSVVVLRQSVPFGREAIFYLFAVVWGTDCMAYFGGRLIGGVKLAPRFSPSKTWSGFLVGITSGSLLGWAVSPAPACVGCMIVLGLMTGAVAQGGDIFESFIKRRFKVKDAGSLIPGHGGLMDRLDGFIAAAVFAVILGVWRAGADAAGAGLFQW